MHSTPLISSMLAVLLTLGAADVASAQDEPDASPPPSEEAGPADESAAPSPDPDVDADSARRAEAQAEVDQAKKLAKIQRTGEAITLIEDAYLVLEDPELLRMLGELHADEGDLPKALHAFDAYLAEPDVGDMAKGPVRSRRAKLAAQLETPNRASTEPTDDPSDDDGWYFAGHNGGTAGHLYLSLGGRISHLQGPSYDTTVGGVGPDAADPISGSWVHGGIGLVAGVGGYLLDNLSLGLELGNEWVNWEVRSADADFRTTLISGLRPELALVARTFVGVGFYVGLAVGGDMVVFSEPITRATCAGGGDCAPVELAEGVAGYRGFGGLSLGYRTDLVEQAQIGLDISWRYLPFFSATQQALEELPSYTDPSWILGIGFSVTYNL